MKKLLIVDDSPELLEAIEFFLSRQGYRTKTLPNANNLIEEIKNLEPDLLILDVFIGGTDGREVCKKLRKNSVSKYLCVILFSASADAIVDYEYHGADGCIEKPFSLTHMLKEIERVLHKCKDHQPAI